MGGNSGDDTALDEDVQFGEAKDLAFFVVNFGYSKTDYLQLTEVEKRFIIKAWEGKFVTDAKLLRDAVLNAYVNANRKKGQRFVEFFKKRPKQLSEDEKRAADNLAFNIEKDARENRSWIEKIYAGFNRPAPSVKNNKEREKEKGR